MRRGRPGAVLLLLLPVLAGTVAGGAAPRVFREDCGRRPLLDSAAASPVVGGHDAQTGAWPWDPYSWRAVLGVYNLWKHGKYTAKKNIKSITVHSEFNGDTFENDIALFQLSSAVRFSGYIQPICLPPAHLDAYMDNGTACYISGWGRTEEGKTPDMLKEAQVEIIPSSICNGSDAYGGLVKKNMICAGSRSGGTDTCQGDSGGPLACYDPSTNKYYLIGIASFGLGCGQPKFPGIYVRLSQYGRWIESELLSNKAENPVSITLSIFLAVVCIVLVKTF